MSASIIGKIKSAKNKTYEVKWDQFNKDTYVSYAGWSYVGKADSAKNALQKAEWFLYNK